MCKHGTNRPSIVAILAMSALLFANLMDVVFAASNGSQSQSGSAVWIVDDGSSACNGNSIDTSDNSISGNAYLWLKSTRALLGGLEYEIVDRGGKVRAGGGLLGLQWFTCGDVYQLSAGIPDPGTGTWTVRVFQDGKTFGSDSARFE